MEIPTPTGSLGHPTMGLPRIDRESLAVLMANGDVAVARHCRLELHHLQGSAWECCFHADLPEAITALADSASGLLVAAGSSIQTLHDGRWRHLATVDGSVRSLVATAPAIHAVVSRPGRLDGTLVEIDPLQAAILSERSLRSSSVTLTTDVNGAFLAIADGLTLRTMRTAAGRPCPVEAEPEPTRPQPAPDPCCPCRDPHGKGDLPPDPEQNPLRPAPPEPCEPGQSGVPTPDGGSIVGNGGGVTKNPPPGLGRPLNPCHSALFFRVDRITFAGAHLVAADREGRNVAVLATSDLQVLQRAQFRRGAVVLTHPAQSRMLVFDHGTQKWAHDLFDGFRKEALERTPEIFALNEPMTWTGSPLPLLRGTRSPAIGVHRVLVVPVLDPGQAFNDPDLPKLANYFKRAGFSQVKAYYQENSFGALDFDFAVHGVDAGTGGPVRLPKPVSEYYEPQYVGAHVDLIKPGLASIAVVFDGRERFTLNVQPQKGGQPPATLQVQFSAFLASGKHDTYPAQVRFAGTETATIFVRRPNGATAALNLRFTALTVNIAGNHELATALPQIETYLDGVIAAAETAAGITPRLFTRPAIRRVDQGTGGPGLLITTLSHALTTGPKLEVTSVTYSGAQDPLGFGAAIAGRITSVSSLTAYLDFVTVLAQEKAGFDVNRRRLAQDPVVKFESGTLTSTLFIALEDGGPGATMSVSNIVEMAALFDSVTAVPNTNVTSGRSLTPKDGEAGFDGIVSDVYTAVVNRLAVPGKHLEKKADIEKFFQPYQTIVIAVIHPAVAGATPDFVRPEEMWAAGPSSWGGVRAVEGPRTAVFRPNPKEIQHFSNWSLVPFSVTPDYLLFCHELGHAIGFDDLYARQAGYRDDLLYMDTWAMMHNHGSRSHHCGYHKLQAGWIDEGRVETVQRPQADQTLTREVLLVPVEHWRPNDALKGAAQAAFNRPDLRVVQLVELDLGGDADVFGLIEARTKGVGFSDKLPQDPAVLVTNCIIWWDKNRYAFNGRYRAPVHLLHEGTALRNRGDSFDLARGKELPAKGIVVSILDRKNVAGVEVFHLKVERKHSREFIDLFFSTSDPYYKNPDLWVDWAGDNGPGGKTSSTDPNAARKFPLGAPVDQGELIRVPASGDELHWMVARLRNVGNVRAEQVKLNFSICDPPGAGDRGNFKVVDTVVVPTVPPTGRDNPVFVPSRWQVPAGFKGHTCIMVEVADLKVPLDASGAALASDDVVQANNRAQKNVDQIGPKSASPFEPVDFEFSVNNSGRSPEVVYLEPEALPYGMTLTVMPKRRKVAAGETAIFRCSLQLDNKIIDASCRGDHDFRINAWRVDEESAILWGGVEYQVRPRKRSTTDLSGWWDSAGQVEIRGNVAPGNIVGQVRIRLAYAGHAARWVTADLQPGGTFVYREKAPANTFELLTMALFEGNKFYSESRSPERRITPPTPLR